jgi:hypothetical protein
LAQSSKNNVISSEKTDRAFSIKTDQGVYHFASLKANIIETVFVPTDESLDSSSHAVILDRNNQPFTVQENTNSLQLTHHEVEITFENRLLFSRSFDHQRCTSNQDRNSSLFEHYN